MHKSTRIKALGKANDKLNTGYTYRGIYSALKRNDILPEATTQMSPKDVLCEIVTKTQISHDSAYMWYLESSNSKRWEVIRDWG